MQQGDFNHMANIITVLFEQIIAKNLENASLRDGEDARMSKLYLDLPKFYLSLSL